MNPTLPLVQRWMNYEEEPFAPDEGCSLTLVGPDLDPRLLRAGRLLFPDQEWTQELTLTAVWPDQKEASPYAYMLLWGPDHSLSEELQFFLKENPFSVQQLPAEGYRLSMRKSSVFLGAHDAAGLFYGLHTLRQLLDSGRSLSATDIVDWPDVPLRCMNYDLRQTFSKPELLINYIPTLASFKANALLVEYEDKFPFSRHPDFRHPSHALSDHHLEQLLETAEQHFIEVIPLQQTFGHLEYILGRKEYQHLRESATSTGELCPSLAQSFTLVSELVAEVAERHPRSRYVHLGCDEVYSLCECPRCREQYSGSRNLAFLDFVNKLIDYTCRLGKQPIIWQDVLAACSDEELDLLDPRVCVMIWHYNGKNIEALVSPLSAKLQARGIMVMGAPSVRCFDRKDDQNYPLVEQRMANINQWSNVATQQQLSGLVGTNWTAVFSLGVPYGPFETSWYTMAYFADACWHAKRSQEDRFIDRFLLNFHGIEIDMAKRLLGNYDDEDYYTSMPKLLEAVVKNRSTAELIAAMLEFETAADRSRTIHKYVYRWQLSPQSEAEWRSLMNNYRITQSGLRHSRVAMEEALRVFQPDDMVHHYVLSRFYLHDYLQETLYQEIGLAEPDSAEEGEL